MFKRTTLHAAFIFFLFFGIRTGMSAQSYPIVFDFTTTSDTQQAYTATLQNGAKLEQLGDYGVLNLGDNNGYLDFTSAFGEVISGLGSIYTIAVNVFVPEQTSISANGNFIWCFANSSTDGYMFLGAKETRCSITTATWTSEQSVNVRSPLEKGRWVNLIYVQNKSTGTLFIDNQQRAQNQKMTLTAADLGSTSKNYLGRSCYSGDAYLKGARYADFRVYNKVIDQKTRKELFATAEALNRLETGIETDADLVAVDAELLQLPRLVYNKVTLPTEGKYGSSIMWTSLDPDYIDDQGTVVQCVDEPRPVTLTATFTYHDAVTTRDFVLTLKPLEPYSAYLFVFFPSNSDENIYYAISKDGFNYTTLNNGKRIVAADGITYHGGLRDPHILRGDDGWFYMTATDMRSALGWASNRGLVLFRSRDLITWTSHYVNFPSRYKGTFFANVTRVWAPETIYDPVAQKYMVYFSILTNDGTVPYDKVFYCYANPTFTNLENEPIYFYDRGSATIDMDIVFNEADSLYHAFYKNEGSGGICKVTAKSLTAPAGEEGSQWSDPSSTLQQTGEAVEGAGVFRLINSDSWVLMYDCYANGHYQFCTSNDLDHFTFAQNTATSGSFTPRHGTVLPVTPDEAKALIKKYPTTGLNVNDYTESVATGVEQQSHPLSLHCEEGEMTTPNPSWRRGTNLTGITIPILRKDGTGGGSIYIINGKKILIR